MPNAGSGWGTTQPYIPVIPAGQRAKLPGSPLLFANQAELEAAVTAERGNIDIAAIWMQGQELRVATEGAAVRLWTLGVDAASSHARVVQLPSGVTLTLGADTSRVHLTSGAPSVGLGANGDIALDPAAGGYYLRGASAWAAAVSMYPVQVPPADTAAPSMVGSITLSGVTDTSAVLSWTAGTDNTGVSGYQYSLDGGNTYTPLGNVLTTPVSNLAPATTYPVRVRAVDAAGNASAPLSASLTTQQAPDTTAPTLVGSIEITNVGTDTATLTLPVGADNVAVAGYRYSLNGGVSYIDLSAARTVNLTGLSASTTYPIRAVAYDAAGNTSAPLSATLTTATPAPAGNALQTHVATLALTQWSTLTAPAKGGINSNLCTASISGDVMTVTAAAQNSIGDGQFVVRHESATPAVATNTVIVQQLTGTPRGVGTYRVSVSQNMAQRAVQIHGKLPRQRHFFDGNALFPSDDDVAANQGSNGGGIGLNMIDGYSAIRINPATGQVVYRGGGHGNGSDGTIYGFDFRDGPGRTWRALVPGGKLRSAAEDPPAWWNAVVQPATLVTTTATGTAGQNTLVVANATGMTASANGAFVFAAEGGIPSGAAVTAVSGNNLTLSKPLTASFSNRAIRYTRAAYWVSENVNGHQVPPAAQMYGCNAFLPGTDTLVLGAGMFVAGGDYQGNIGAGWAYSPSYASNGGMIGPLQVPYNATARHPELARYGYCFQAAFGGPGLTIPCDLDGKLYTFGRTYNDGNNVPALWRWDTPTSTPVAAWVGNGGYRIAVPCAYFVNNAVCFPDPRFAGGTKRAIFHDQKRSHSVPRVVVWSDITGTPTDYLIDWTPPDVGWNDAGGHAPGYCWNSDKGVMAVTDGIDVWEFAITFNGTNYVMGAATKLTSGATGDVPTQKSSDVGYGYATLDYYPPARCYLHAQDFTLRVIRAE